MSAPDSPTSETLHGVTAQPPPTCPLIDDALDEVHRILKAIRRYERASEDEMREMLSEVEQRLGYLSGYGDTGLLEDIRARTIDIREWGEEWKTTALDYHDRLPEEHRADPLTTTSP